MKLLILIFSLFYICSATNIYIINIQNISNVTLYQTCVPAIQSDVYAFANLKVNIRYEMAKIAYFHGFCNDSVSLDYSKTPAIIINDKIESCSLHKRLSNAQRSNVKLLVISSERYTDLPTIQTNISIVITNISLWNDIEKWNKNSPDSMIKLAVYGVIPSAFLGQIATSATITSIVVLVVLLIVLFNIVCFKEIQQSVGNISQTDSKKIKWIILIFPISTVTILLLLYFFYNIMVWVIIILFCIISIMQLVSVLMLIVNRFQLMPNLICHIRIHKEFKVDLRIVFILLMGTVLAVLWFVYRKQEVGLILNNVIGVYLCLGITLTIGAIITYNKNFKVILTLMVLILILDAVMVFTNVVSSKKAVSAKSSVMPYQTNYTASTSTVLSRSARGDNSITSQRERSSIMEEVALGTAGTNKEEIPVRFKLPIFDLISAEQLSHFTCYETSGFSILGFGDVVLPGIFMTFVLLFARATNSRYCIYGAVCATSYVVGMILTLTVLYLTKAGQPALIYLIPCTVLPVIVLAQILGDLSILWSGNWEPTTPAMFTGEENAIPIHLNGSGDEPGNFLIDDKH